MSAPIRHWLAAAWLAACAPAGAQQEITAEEDRAAAPAAPDWTAKAVAAMPAPLGAKTRLLSLARAGERLVAVGQQGVIMLSDDGQQWRQAKVPVSQLLTRVRFQDVRNGWAVGYDSVILQTGDGGESWAVRRIEAGARPLYDIAMLDAERGIAVGGYGTYLVTVDGGKNWAPQASPLADLGLHFNVLQKLEDGRLVLAGEKGLLAVSADAGANWKMLKSPYAGSFFGALPLAGGKLLAYGMRGNIFVVADLAAGAEQDIAAFDPYAVESLTDPAQIAALGWQRLENPSKESLFGAARLDSGEVLLVGINGTALETEFAAGRVKPVKLKADETLVDLQVYKNKLIAVGKRGAQLVGEKR